MTDREMLEFAAKAAGLKYTKPHPDYSGVFGLVLDDEHGRPTADWNPLKDDGDALRLAVKLRIRIEHNSQFDDGLRVMAFYGDGGCAYEDPIDESQRQSAARLAILRAAAEIGKAMQ